MPRFIINRETDGIVEAPVLRINIHRYAYVRQTDSRAARVCYRISHLGPIKTGTRVRRASSRTLLSR